MRVVVSLFNSSVFSLFSFWSSSSSSSSSSPAPTVVSYCSCDNGGGDTGTRTTHNERASTDQYLSKRYSQQLSLSPTLSSSSSTIQTLRAQSFSIQKSCRLSAIFQEITTSSSQCKIQFQSSRRKIKGEATSKPTLEYQ